MRNGKAKASTEEGECDEAQASQERRTGIGTTVCVPSDVIGMAYLLRVNVPRRWMAIVGALLASDADHERGYGR